MKGLLKSVEVTVELINDATKVTSQRVYKFGHERPTPIVIVNAMYDLIALMEGEPTKTQAQIADSIRSTMQKIVLGTKNN